MTAKRVLGALAIAIAIVCGAFFAWIRMPVHTQYDTADPALVFINSMVSTGELFQENYFEHDGQNLHFIHGGDQDQELILFLHGFPSFWFSFVRQLQDFRQDYRVVAIDGLGVGRSGAPHSNEPYALEAMAEHLRALIDYLGADKVHLVGHDWGAVFAFGLAQRYPELVLSVTGISAPPQNVILELLDTDPSARDQFAYIETLKSGNAAVLLALDFETRIWEGAYAPLVAEGKLNAEEGELFRHATSDPKRVDAHINWYRQNIPTPDDIAQTDYWPFRGARIVPPALFVWGDQDKLISAKLIEQVALVSDDLRLLELEGVGHWPHLQRPEAVNAAIRSLLSAHPSSP